MNRHGERFLKVNDFIAHCRSLNVRTDERELEHYEKIGAMLPVARKVYPEEYFIHQRQHEYVLDPLVPLADIDKQEYPELHRLTEKVLHLGFPCGFKEFSDEELVHCFDREMGSNPYLILPGDSEFKPWDDYEVKVSEYQGREFKESLAEHFYSYWQVHQLCWIKNYPDLYQNASLLELIPEERMPTGRPFPPSKKRLAGFDGLRQHFDALSFWATAYIRERFRTFANVAVVNGVRRVDDDEAASYRRRLKELSMMVADRFDLSREKMYEFLCHLIDRYEQYESQERYKLAGDLKMDIFHLERLIESSTGDGLVEISDELRLRSTHNREKCEKWEDRTFTVLDYATTFRHLDEAWKERDYALYTIKHKTEDLPIDWSFSAQDADSLVSYCEERGLDLMLTALGSMSAVGEEGYRRNFRRVRRYSNLVSALTMYEVFLKSVANNEHPDIINTALGPAISKTMDKTPWFARYKKKRKAGGVNTTGVEDFICKLKEIQDDCELQSGEAYWARVFLITHLSRNFVSHHYITQDSGREEFFDNRNTDKECVAEDDVEINGNSEAETTGTAGASKRSPFVEALDAVILAMCYTWKLAQNRKWV